MEVSATLPSDFEGFDGSPISISRLLSTSAAAKETPVILQTLKD